MMNTMNPSTIGNWHRPSLHSSLRCFARLALTAWLTALALNSTAAADADIRLNSIGYLPERAKLASILSQDAETFSIRRAADSSVAYSGKLSQAKRNEDTEEAVRLADFSGLTEEGAYYLALEDGSHSAPFRIGPEVYNKSLRLNLIGFYGQRCGHAVSFEHDGETFSYEACHLDDGYLDFYPGEEGRKNGVGGWHDAGDYGKYIVNSGVTVGMMLHAWQRFEGTLQPLALPHLPEAERSNAIPDYLDEVKYNLDWVRSMQFPDGRVSHKLTRQRFSPFIMPHEDEEKRYFSPWSTAATADFVAMMALAARVYEPYAPDFAQDCLEAAWRSYRFLRDHPGAVRADLSAFSTGPYQTDDDDDRLWAAAEMYATTGDAAAHADFLKRAKARQYRADVDWDWSQVGNLGLFTYALSARADRDRAALRKIEAAIVESADELVSNAAAHGYGRAIPRYYWGANGSVARTCMLLNSADILSPRKEYRDTASKQLDHLYGRNYYGRSMVTGEGLNPPQRPHHRPSGADAIAQPWPGHLVGGGHPGAKGWLDEQGSYATNENAINWDGAMAYALAMFAGAEEE